MSRAVQLESTAWTSSQPSLQVCLSLTVACMCPALIEDLLLQFRRWWKEGPWQVQRWRPSGAPGTGEENPEEKARPEKRTTRGLHGQLLRWPGNLPDQDAGEISSKRVWCYKLIPFIRLKSKWFFSQNYLARNFYNLRFLALFVAFAINFILLFYKVRF